MPGTAAPRYSPTKTHMHFQTDEEEEEEEEEVKKRVCEAGRPPQPSLRAGPARRGLRLLTWCGGAACCPATVCLGDRFGSRLAFFTLFCEI